MNLNIWLALWAGFASFISPCCLPLYPSYISYITGISVKQLTVESTRRTRSQAVVHTLFFILGFSIVFITMGYGAGLLGDVFNTNQKLIRQLAGIFIIVMGCFLLGWFQPGWLLREHKLHFRWKPAGYLGSVLVGISFAAGWSPCVGPILGAIVMLAVSQPGAWLPLILAYTTGFAIPFFILAFFIGSSKWLLKYSAAMMKIGGVVMIFMGLLLFTNEMTQITIWLNRITPDWLKF